MAVERLIPSIERRLSGWVNIQEGLVRQPRREPRFTLTISRQFGCEGYPLAERLQALLGVRTGESWTVFDKALIERVSREAHLSERLLGSIGDESRTLDKLAAVIPGWRTHSEAYEVLVRYIVRIAKEGNAIIVGQGGAVVAQDLPNCFHFRLEAPHEHRVESIQKRLGVAREEAERLVTEHHERRDRFIESFLRCSIADTRYYNAVYNTAKNPLERIAHSILELIGHRESSG